MYFMQMAQHKETSHIGNVVGAYIYEKESMDARIFGEGQLFEFEKINCRVPEQIENFLTEIYGAKYMEFPPKNKRKTHNPKFVSFSENYRK